MRNEKRTVKKSAGAFRRTLAKLLVFLMMFSLLPPLTPEAKAASWMDPYLDTVVDWGVMRGDNSGNLNENRRITRAEFVTLVNRAFGYTEVGPNPFSDVPDTAWYAEDICIAVKAGYFNGTSATTASPNAPVTREQAAVLIARNLRLQGGTGDVLDFTDSRQMGTWSRGLVQEAAKLGIIQGYDDGSFKPKNPITRGQVAVFLVRALGTLIQEPGEHSGMGVYGHLTINSPGVTLKDSVVTGNLYLTGGVGLENLELENVTVKGRIVVCGAGESQKGESSVLLRNVTAEALEVDSLTNQFLSVRSEGLTNIGTTTVRTSAFIEDLTENGLGLKSIKLDGASGTQLQLAGNIKEVVNLTPNSTLNFAQGVGHQVTVDEKATGSTLNIDGTANLKDLNLDVGTNVTGVGDINHVNINAPGSTVTMLPDTITVRPGITGNISKEEMDSAAAAESSEDPRILSGYPRPQNLAPKSAEVAFSTNKRGTLYWAVTALTDGSVKEEQLINPPSYSSVILKSGNITVKESQKVDLAKISGLTTGGSYYVSAVLVDNRGMRSPVKVAAFTTPDDTTPAFSSGYPYVIQTEDEEENLIAQARVMATKDCRLYYALLPKGSTAPTASDFKTASISGNLGYGSEDLKKNTPLLLSRINLAALRQETTYDLYLWLTDVDNGKSSAIKKLTFTTPDKTPPVIQYLKVDDAKAKSITMSFSLNEPGTLHWAVVRKGERFYDAALGDVTDVMKESELAKSQIETGSGGWKKGNKAAAKGTTEYTFTISGLEPETAYDLYYVAKDKATPKGNYNIYTRALTPPMVINTTDEVSPTVEQIFTIPGTAPNAPSPDTSVRLEFSEEVQGEEYLKNGDVKYHPFLKLYRSSETNAADTFATALAQHVKLYEKTNEGWKEVKARKNEDDTDWVIDYNNAVVSTDPQLSGKMTITFPYDENSAESALNLTSGVTYRFVLVSIVDMSTNPRPNPMKTNENTDIGAVYALDAFTTTFATVRLNESGITSIPVTSLVNGGEDLNAEGGAVRVDLSFTMNPSSTEKVDGSILWDLLIWADATMDYTIYSRTQTETGWTNWGKVGKVSVDVKDAPEGKRYVSLTGHENLKNQSSFEALNQFTKTTEIAIHINELTDSAVWKEHVVVGATVLAGPYSAMRLSGLKHSGTTTIMNGALNAGAVSIGRDDPFEYPVPVPEKEPKLVAPQPSFVTGDVGATMYIQVDNPGYVYYAVMPVTKGEGFDAVVIDDTDYVCYKPPMVAGEAKKVGLNRIPTSGRDDDIGPPVLNSPKPSEVTGMKKTGVITGRTDLIQRGETHDIPLENLTPQTTYLVYLVATSPSGGVMSEYVRSYRFTTKEADVPEIVVTHDSTTQATIKVYKSTKISYALVKTSDLLETSFGELFNNPEENWTDTDTGTMTVLEAMLAPATDGSNRSFFDQHATSTARTHFASLIKQTDTQNSEMDVAMSEDEIFYRVPNGEEYYSEPLPMTNMTGTNWYTLLVTGVAAANSETYGCRASRSYYNVNREALTVDCILLGNSAECTASTFTGDLTIRFSDDLHFRVQDSSTGKEIYHPVDGCGMIAKHSGSNNIADGYKNLGSLFSRSALGAQGQSSIKEPSLAHGSPIGDELKLGLTKASVNSVLTFDSEICGSNGITRDKTLKITLKYDKNLVDFDVDTDSGEKVNYATGWYAEVTPAEWLG